MKIAVVVPCRGGCADRERAWGWLREQYAALHPDWEVIEATAPPGPWCKGAAVNPAIERCDADLVIQADADCWTEGLGDAAAAVEAGEPWAIPHQTVYRLTEDGTAKVLAGADWRDQALARRPYRGIAGGGFVVAPRNVLKAVPLDKRFIGWGQDDECHSRALNALCGKPWRGDAALWHLWHPPQDRMTPRRGSRESWALRRRYVAAANDPAAMRRLIEESREPQQAS